MVGWPIAPDSGGCWQDIKAYGHPLNVTLQRLRTMPQIRRKDRQRAFLRLQPVLGAERLSRTKPRFTKFDPTLFAACVDHIGHR